MTANCLDIITRITVEIHKNDISREKLGTGVLYTNRKLSGLAYVLTAKHCLSGLTAKEIVSFRVFSPCNGAYEYITPVKQTILLHPADDAGIIVFNLREFSEICSNIPTVFVVDNVVEFDEAVTKGFPIATLDQTSEVGESSLAMLKMNYLQEVSCEHAFQLLQIMITRRILLRECLARVFSLRRARNCISMAYSPDLLMRKGVR